jgi:putative ATP-grasp target RiPP
MNSDLTAPDKALAAGTRTEPWGWARLTDRLPASPSWYASAVLDPDTQTTRFFDSAGTLIEMGKHGTNVTKGTPSMSGGGDGSKPAPQAQDDTTTDYESD